jgi:alpha-glucoside transport system substrate-binding protein
MTKRWLKLAAVPIALSLVAAACGDDDDDSSSDGTEASAETEAAADEGAEDEGAGDEGGAMDFGGADIVLTGPERDDPSLAGIQAALDIWNERVNANAVVTGDADWEANINTQVEGGNPPDISFFPQPGKLKDFAEAGSILPLPDDVDATVDEFWGEGFQVDGQSRDGVQYGVPAKTDLKSIVWYNPARFEADGYEVPTTFDEFVALVDEITAAGASKPLCVGIESGQATGWAYTDWTEEMVLRQHGVDVYDQWVDHEIPFNDPQIVESMQTVVDIWTDDNVFASGGTIAATNFGDNATPLLDGDCYMHRQANFFASFFPEGTAFADGSEEAIDVFYFPDINGDRPILTAGIIAAAFTDRPEVWDLMKYLATAEYAENRQIAQAEFQGGSLSGYLSGAQGQDPSIYLPLEQSFLDILTSSDNARFDGSDLMPADVGAGTFWSEGTSLVNGDQDAQTAADNIEASWPS